MTIEIPNRFNIGDYAYALKKATLTKMKISSVHVSVSTSRITYCYFGETSEGNSLICINEDELYATLDEFNEAIEVIE